MASMTGGLIPAVNCVLCHGGVACPVSALLPGDPVWSDAVDSCPDCNEVPSFGHGDGGVTHSCSGWSATWCLMTIGNPVVDEGGVTHYCLGGMSAEDIMTLGNCLVSRGGVPVSPRGAIRADDFVEVPAMSCCSMASGNSVNIGGPDLSVLGGGPPAPCEFMAAENSIPLGNCASLMRNLLEDVFECTVAVGNGVELSCPMLVGMLLFVL